MSDSRDEQVRRLAEALCLETTGRAEPCRECLNVAGRAITAGATFPDPPAPVLPVVSEAAVQAYADALKLIPVPWCADGLRAAWPFLLRDSLAALPRYADGNFFLSTDTGIDYIPPWIIRTLSRALGAAPEGP